MVSFCLFANQQEWRCPHIDSSGPSSRRTRAAWPRQSSPKHGSSMSFCGRKNIHCDVAPCQQRSCQESRYCVQHDDHMTGDFNNTCWRKHDGLRLVEMVFQRVPPPLPRGFSPLGCAGGIPHQWLGCGGFLKPCGTQRGWRVRRQGAHPADNEPPCTPPTSQQIKNLG